MLYVTASKDVREALSSNWAGLQNQYMHYNQLMDYGRDASPQEKRERENLPKEIALGEFDRVESPNLRLTKFLHLGNNFKRVECDAVVAVANRNQAKLERLSAQFQFKANLPGERRIKLAMGGRMIVNHAGGVLENAGICLHSNAGVPCIPGSAVKGVSRHAAWCEWIESHENGEIENAKKLALLIAACFGFPSNDNTLDVFCAEQWPQFFSGNGKYAHFAGMVAFMPAMPLEGVKLVTDVCTCHHAGYYQGKQEKWDNESPNPQFFPAVEQGSMFEFVLRPTRRIAYALSAFDGIGESDVLDFAEKSVRSAAEDFGFGSKTSSGYGWFYEDQQKLERIELNKKREAERIQRQIEKERQKEIEAERAEERRDDKRKLDAMSAEERASYEVSKWQPDKINALLCNATSFRKLELDLKVALVRSLADANSALWKTLKERAQNGKKKEKKQAQPIRDEIYRVAKTLTPKVKMP
ncbi:MAG: type III-B CRISPR module RAMP protein Cmr6 [Kiritimatiellia bacterium]